MLRIKADTGAEIQTLRHLPDVLLVHLPPFTANTLNDTPRRRRCRLRQDNGEFITALPEGHVAAPEFQRQQVGKIPQHHITLIMSKGVITFLETVEINHHQRESAPVTLRPVCLQRQHLVKMAAVTDTGKLVGDRLMLDFAYHTGAFHGRAEQPANRLEQFQVL